MSAHPDHRQFDAFTAKSVRTILSGYVLVALITKRGQRLFRRKPRNKGSRQGCTHVLHQQHSSGSVPAKHSTDLLDYI